MHRPHFSRPSRDRRVVLFTVHSQSDLNSVRQKLCPSANKKTILLRRSSCPGRLASWSPSFIVPEKNRCRPRRRSPTPVTSVKKLWSSRSWLSVSSTNAGRHCSGYVLTFPAKHIIILLIMENATLRNSIILLKK
jgi:hypothetical protein